MQKSAVMTIKLRDLLSGNCKACPIMCVKVTDTVFVGVFLTMVIQLLTRVEYVLVIHWLADSSR